MTRTILTKDGNETQRISNFNGWAGLFGVFYPLVKGQFKVAGLLLIVNIVIGLAIILMCEGSEVSIVFNYIAFFIGDGFATPALRKNDYISKGYVVSTTEKY